MKKIVLDFVRRGLMACGFGPLVLAVFYLLLQRHGGIHSLTVDQVCLGIFSLSALAFIAGGMNVLYRIERLPLAIAILIHGGTLYISYLATYLLNGWLAWGKIPILVFTGIFLFGYLVVWAIIFCATKRNTRRLNKMLIQKRRSAEQTSD